MPRQADRSLALEWLEKLVVKQRKDAIEREVFDEQDSIQEDQDVLNSVNSFLVGNPFHTQSVLCFLCVFVSILYNLDLLNASFFYVCVVLFLYCWEWDIYGKLPGLTFLPEITLMPTGCARFY
jgi:hypothetical protein